jgi:hippurate hydrolase
MAAQSDLDARISKEMDPLVATYKHLHANPELSLQEKETAALVARELRGLGYEVTERIGKYDPTDAVSYGLVGVLRNGAGPTVLVRTELDALPMEEKTGVAYASHVRVKRDGGEVGVMHACGHDLHMTAFLGTATILAQIKSQWHGTLIMLGQPAEEVGRGARAMLDDGLYARFPRPDFVLALHDSAELAAGTVGWHAGPSLASADSVDIIVRGVGGHGALPQMTKDPIVIASEIVVALQTIVSREMLPFDPAVITVGSFHAGTKHNIIPDEAHLQLTVRAFTPEVREHLLASIARIAKGIAEAAGVPADRMPTVEVSKGFTPAMYNDPALTSRVVATLERALGKENVLAIGPAMPSDDFAFFGIEAPRPPIFMFSLGAVDPVRFREAKAKGLRIPGPHSSEFAPAPEPAIRTGVKAMSSAVLELMK